MSNPADHTDKNDDLLEQSHPVTALSGTVAEPLNGLRIDQAVAGLFKDISRERAKKLIAIGAVWLNSVRTQIVSRTVRSGDMIAVYSGRRGASRYYEIDPANILFRDQWLLFYRKEPGVPTQGVVCDNYNNIFAGLQRHLKQQQKSPAYLGMHQRLDLDTSGVVLFTLSPKVNRSIHYQFKDHRVKKIYRALVAGNPGFSELRLSNFIYRHAGRYRCSDTGPGKQAVTQFRMLKAYDGFSFLEAEPETGRTHQLRLQLAHFGNPILGDRLYGAAHAQGPGRTMLHAISLSVVHPVTQKKITVVAPLFQDMLELIENAAGGAPAAHAGTALP
ncbi:MAG: RluA family pseudouridine synthase [Deltaproteobacteria bacterium]|nr:RluA family pseudouridine synthase [Deltaproteobacteria bacterium]